MNYWLDPCAKTCVQKGGASATQVVWRWRLCGRTEGLIRRTRSQSGDSGQEAGRSPCNGRWEWTALLHMQQHHCEGMQELSDSATAWLAWPLPIVPLSPITPATCAGGRKAIAWFRGSGLVSSLSSDNLLTCSVRREKNDSSHSPAIWLTLSKQPVSGQGGGSKDIIQSLRKTQTWGVETKGEVLLHFSLNARGQWVGKLKKNVKL